VGNYFGEIAYLVKTRRSATIKTKNYSTIGKVSEEHFNELLHVFPDIKKGLRQRLQGY